MALASSLTYPKKSHRKPVQIPPKSSTLAEFFGIMIGDGGINNAWQANVSLNSIADAEYATYVARLFQDLFAVAPAIRKRRGRNVLVVSLASTSIVDFLATNGLSRGDKLKDGLRIPDWILARRAWRLACVRGLVDTDGCLYIHRHRVSGRSYQNIGFCFSSHSPELLRQVATILEACKITPHINKKGTEIYLYRADAVERYLEIFGTSNQRIVSVYRTWKGG